MNMYGCALVFQMIASVVHSANPDCRKEVTEFKSKLMVRNDTDQVVRDIFNLARQNAVYESCIDSIYATMIKGWLRRRDPFVQHSIVRGLSNEWLGMHCYDFPRVITAVGIDIRNGSISKIAQLRLLKLSRDSGIVYPKGMKIVARDPSCLSAIKKEAIAKYSQGELNNIGFRGFSDILQELDDYEKILEKRDCAELLWGIWTGSACLNQGGDVKTFARGAVAVHLIRKYTNNQEIDRLYRHLLRLEKPYSCPEAKVHAMANALEAAIRRILKAEYDFVAPGALVSRYMYDIPRPFVPKWRNPKISDSCSINRRFE